MVVRVGCAQTPSLISVLVPGWLRSGDMMVDGVLRDAVRPLCLMKAVHLVVAAGACREPAAVHRRE